MLKVSEYIKALNLRLFKVKIEEQINNEGLCHILRALSKTNFIVEDFFEQSILHYSRDIIIPKFNDKLRWYTTYNYRWKQQTTHVSGSKDHKTVLHTDTLEKTLATELGEVPTIYKKQVYTPVFNDTTNLISEKGNKTGVFNYTSCLPSTPKNLYSFLEKTNNKKYQFDEDLTEYIEVYYEKDSPRMLYDKAMSEHKKLTDTLFIEALTKHIETQIKPEVPFQDLEYRYAINWKNNEEYIYTEIKMYYAEFQYKQKLVKAVYFPHNQIVSFNNIPLNIDQQKDGAKQFQKNLWYLTSLISILFISYFFSIYFLILTLIPLYLLWSSTQQISNMHKYHREKMKTKLTQSTYNFCSEVI